MSHKLTSKQQKAVHLLAGGMTTIEASRHLGLRRETLSRWKQIPEFHTEIERVTQELCFNMRHRLLGLVDDSIAAVKKEFFAYKCDPKRIQMALNLFEMLGIHRVMMPDASEKEEKPPVIFP